jgi:hypothetical protein
MIALFQPAGTVCRHRGGRRGGPEDRYLVTWDGTFEDVVFRLNTVHVHVPGDAFWVIRQWNGDRNTGWYINLAAPWRRTSIGFDHEDHALDINVANDLSYWSWKDEDGLAWMIERGLYSSEKGVKVRAAGAAAVARMEARQPPFHDDWSTLVPDPHWPVPQLAVAWNAVDLF